MLSSEPLVPSPAGAPHHDATAVALDADFEARWAAWVIRGAIHEQQVRRKLVVWAGVLSTAAAIAYAFLRMTGHM